MESIHTPNCGGVHVMGIPNSSEGWDEPCKCQTFVPYEPTEDGRVVQKIGTQKVELAPHPQGIVSELIAAQMMKEREAEGPRATATGTRLRASAALTCARQMGFAILGVPETRVIPPEVLMAFDVGQKFHTRLQEVMVEQLNATVEVVGDYGDIADLSCHADAVYDRKIYNPGVDEADWPNQKVLVEIKTISGFGFLICVGARRSDEGAGPKTEHVAQAAICANAPNINAQVLHMVYVDKDKHSIAEWFLDMDTPLDRYEGLTPRELAEAEIERMRGVLGRLDSGMLPARHIPGVGRVQTVPDPDGRGNPWNCRYCGWNALCKPMAPIPLSFEDAGIEIIEVNGKPQAVPF